MWKFLRGMRYRRLPRDVHTGGEWRTPWQPVSVWKRDLRWLLRRTPGWPLRVYCGDRLWTAVHLFGNRRRRTGNLRNRGLRTAAGAEVPWRVRLLRLQLQDFVQRGCRLRLWVLLRRRYLPSSRLLNKGRFLGDSAPPALFAEGIIGLMSPVGGRDGLPPAAIRRGWV
jgi:hypothetical protein